MREAPITGAVLRWARERRGLDYGGLSGLTKVSIDQLRDWEEGLSFPPLGKAEMLADVLKIPFGFLFLSQPPIDSAPIADFRTVNGKPPRQPSPDLLSLINLVTTKQEWFRDFAEENNAERIPVVGSFKLTSRADVVAESLASTLHISEELRRSVSHYSSYLARLAEAAQEAGVMVMRGGIVGLSNPNRLSVAEFRGFALTDPYAPVVFINSRDAVSAQIFSLLHELTHIWLNRSGISNPDPSEYNAEKIEVFCSRVAAEALMPKDEFLAAWGTVLDRASFAVSLSRRFWVSPLAIIVRAFELKKISDTEFFRLAQIEKSKQPRAVPKAKGGNPTAKVLARNSRRFTTAVLRALKDNRLAHRDAAWLLGVRRPGLTALMARPPA